ncbi:MAG: lysophospholipid acyltransferase family protein [Pseudomonadota bacterium]
MAERIARIGRWFRQSPRGQALGAWIGALYITVVHISSSWRVDGASHLDGLLERRCGFVASTWHGRLFLIAALARRGRKNVAMISNNRDGDLIAAVVARFGIASVRGSSYDHAKDREKGGREALSGALEALKADDAILCVTPDGPRGPRMRAQMGVAVLSASAGVPVLPVAFSSRRGVVLRSWDRFLIPWPFTRGWIVYGVPLDPPQRRERGMLEAFCDRIEAETIAVTQRADQLCGRDPVAPAASLASR